MLHDIDVYSLTGSALARERIFVLKYISVSPREEGGGTLETSGLRMSIQPSSPFHPSSTCVNNNENFVFSEIMVFTTWCAPFPNRISHFKLCLRSMCSVHCLREPKWNLAFPIAWK